MAVSSTSVAPYFTRSPMSTFHFWTKPETLAYSAVRSYALITPGCSTVRFTVRYWAWTTLTAGSRLIGDAGGGSGLEQPHARPGSSNRVSQMRFTGGPPGGRGEGRRNRRGPPLRAHGRRGHN